MTSYILSFTPNKKNYEQIFKLQGRQQQQQQQQHNGQHQEEDGETGQRDCRGRGQDRQVGVKLARETTEAEARIDR